MDGLACAITDWLTKHWQHLGPDALAAVIPAARRVSSAQQQQAQQQLEQWLLPQAANNISAVCDTDQFKSTWGEDDVRVLLAASSETRTGVKATIRAVQRWVLHDQPSRQQHWAGLLDCLDFSRMSAADMASVSTDDVAGSNELMSRMFAALVARQMEAEQAAQGRSSRS